MPLGGKRCEEVFTPSTKPSQLNRVFNQLGFSLIAAQTLRTATALPAQSDTALVIASAAKKSLRPQQETQPAELSFLPPLRGLFGMTSQLIAKSKFEL
ncbi:MAG: hypothetical protein KIS80_10370 [Anaerolineales bacterium]|nr:hypothetical protein [Anaerolineales bacterium]